MVLFSYILSILGDRLPAQAGLMVGQMWYTYILKSENHKWYYVGSTSDLTRRLKEHNSGKVPSTKNKLPLNLAYKKGFTLEKEAREFERKLKSKRIEKEQLIKQIENWGIV